MPLPIGRFIADGQILSSIVLSRTVDVAAGSFIMLGEFATGSGQHSMFISVKDTVNSNLKQFSFSLNHSHTAGEWFNASPLDIVGSPIANDYGVEVKSDGVTAAIRFKKASGSDPITLVSIIQNMGSEDSNFISDITTGTDTVLPAGELSAIPFGTSSTDHNQLANRGVKPHSVIDAHIDSSIGHIGHENTSNKGQPNGYTPLNSSGKVGSPYLPFGTSAGTVCQGDDSRLAGGLPPGAHADSHSNSGADPISLENLGGLLPQAKSHDQVDTDESISAIHHTIGTGANQAASGAHDHSGVYPTIAAHTGHVHNGTDSAQIPHANLSDAGNYPHDDIDSHMDAASPHSGHEVKAAKNQPLGYAGLDSNGQLLSSAIPFGSAEGQSCEGDDSRLSDARTPVTHADSHKSAGADPLVMSDLTGSLPQSSTHDSPDTDAFVTSLHHTLGTGPTQAAPGDHSHSGFLGTSTVHDDLSGSGDFTHAEIDEHLLADAPHSGHEVTSAKNQPLGYSGLDADGKLLSGAFPFGFDVGQPCEGNDPRLSDNRYPTVHADSHGSLGADPITIADLEGSLPQSRTHVTPDTDTSISSIHHTLGSSATQAASGDHLHTGVYSEVLHDHSLGNGETIDHNNLNNSGVSSHADIDTHLGASAPHAGHTLVSDRNQPLGYAGLGLDGYVSVAQLPPSIKEIRVVNLYADLATLDAFEGLRAHVKDASDDPTVTTGWAEYLYDGTGWEKTSELESMDVVLDWANIQNAPSSPVVSIDGAVNLAHPLNEDTVLAFGTVNEIFAQDIRQHVDAANPHSGHALKSDKGIADGYAGLDSNTKLLPANYTFGILANTVCEGNDARLSDDRTALLHSLITDVGLGDKHSISGGVSGYVFKATGANTAQLVQLDHSELSGIGTNSHAAIDSHIAATAPHSGHSLTTHLHTGVYEPVFTKNTGFNKDFGTTTGTVSEGDHAHAIYSLDTHVHTGVYEPVFTKNTGFNKDFGTIAGTVSEGDHAHAIYSLTTHLHTGAYEPVFTKNTGFNKNFGATAGTVSEGNHLHTGTYEPAFAKNTGFNKNFGTTAGTVSEGDHAHATYSLTTHVHTGVYEPAFTKNTGFNKNFGTAAGTVSEGSHTHATYSLTTHLHTGVYLPIGGTAVDSDLLGGLGLPSTTVNNEINKIVRTDASGYANFGWINTVSGSATTAARIYCSQDAYIRYMTSANFAAAIKADMLTALLTVDGTGTGLDADLLDGNHASAFATAGHVHATLTRGTGLTGSNYTGAAATTWAVAYGTAAGTACQGNDIRLSDARTPLTHSHTPTEVGLSNVDNIQQVNAVASGSTADPNTTTSGYILSNHANTPGGGVYWHILTLFYSSTTGNRTQIATPYNGTAYDGMIFVRKYYSTWDAWASFSSRIRTSAPASPVDGDIWMV